MKRILMVCLGNICRSPLAEGILKSKVDPNEITVDSAATSNYHIGSTPDPRSISTAILHNIDISDQRGRQFQVSDFDHFDKIYVMDNSNYRNVKALARDRKDIEKIDLILNTIFPGQDRDVPDPYYGGEDGFEKVYKMLDEACSNIASELSY
ncbi:low molecular weight protein-tyrosine-phosphatase [Robertkochia solimangrovi]|uniref:low molecular weight protein-tyrosine-phosphatase n=1 Tax=Robertkochia solimangrovi TaxID=2213046 RepID=UPI00117C50B4|nr:low molecular weight protein-tyrosine-phosphatase [Robertkochia solimangrovi]TRZ41058.1 low molecular weight phosphotyrosine protein phosphatase [Robertkochia solimangrovi]